ncbi:MHS family MFS transporter [Rhodovastum atsumiense]|uniref:MHS family MFS transporter n=1 Tax=Rhodovastum atsumiense TaxID=504468 RepID=A0A5M6IVA6_9PROT|nr:MHS family MFS transporter [Rhodovastum atsumiense]
MDGTAPELTTRQLRRVVAASFAGALLEWYDFFIFGTAAGLVFGRLFFPASDPGTATIAAFATFGVGFFARPIGGLVFGHYGDLVGRKATLIATLLITGGSTFLIGVLPTYHDVGLLAPALLVMLRLIQGFGLGGEYGGAALMTIESAPAHRRGFLGSLPQTAASAGIMLATGVFALCAGTMSEATFLSWGWRVPFLLSAVMLVVGMLIRLHVEETPDFRAARAREAVAPATRATLPIVLLLRHHPRNIVLALGARLAETVSSNTVNAFGIAYVATQLGRGRDLPLTGMLIASAIGIVTCPLFGLLSDRVGQRKIYLAGAMATLLLIFPFFALLGREEAALVCLAFILVYNLGPTAMFAVQPTLFAQMFGTRVRYTGLSFAYQMSAILGGLTPLIAAWLLGLGEGLPWLVAGYVALVALLSFICVLLIRETPAAQPATGLANAGIMP